MRGAPEVGTGRAEVFAISGWKSPRRQTWQCALHAFGSLSQLFLDQRVVFDRVTQTQSAQSVDAGERSRPSGWAPEVEASNLCAGHRAPIAGISHGR